MANQYQTGLGGDAPKMLAVLWSLTALALVFVTLRLYTRVRVIRAYGLDDYFYNASFVCASTFGSEDVISRMCCPGTNK